MSGRSDPAAQGANPAFAILVVDDESYVLASVETDLRSDGFTNIATARYAM